MNVLSLFDGISCGQLALQRAGIFVENYYASEIDKYAIKITQKNFPKTVQLGDVRYWKSWSLPKIDLLIAGSPCQGFSNAGKRLNFDDPRSKLFFDFVDTLKFLRDKNPDLIFILENVRMKQEWQDVISEQLGVKPIKINSALVSAQNRVRLYWTNIQGITQPEDKHIYLKDIIEYGDVDEKYLGGYNPAYKSQSNSLHDLNGKYPNLCAGTHRYALGYINIPDKSKTVRSSGRGSKDRHEWDRIPIIQGAAIRNQVTKRGVEEQLNIRKDEKSNAVVPSYPNRLNGVIVKTIGHGYIPESEKEMNQYPSLCGQSPRSKHLLQDTTGYRKLTPLECERLQTLPDGYTEGISNTQRYKCIGNGWTADVVTHILSFIPNKAVER